MASSTSGRKRGRPSKGPRVFTAVRLPLPYRDGVEDIAKSDGIDIQDVITRIIGEYLGLPIPGYAQPKTSGHQEELPLTKAS